MIKLNKLKLRNFKCYDNFETDIPDGFVLVIGRNGSGKSSLMEAIYASIVGRGFTKTLNQLLRENEEDGYIELQFTIDKDEYTITRYFGKYSKVELVKNNEVVSNASTIVKKLMEGLFPDSETLKIHFIKDISLKEYLLTIIDVEKFTEGINVLHQRYHNDVSNFESNILNLKKTKDQKQLEYDEINAKLQLYESQLFSVNEQLKTYNQINYDINYLLDLKQKQDVIKDKYTKFLQENMQLISSYDVQLQQIQQRKIQQIQKKGQVEKMLDEINNQLLKLEENIVDDLYKDAISKITETYNSKNHSVSSDINKLENQKAKIAATSDSETKEQISSFNFAKSSLEQETKQLQNKIEEHKQFIDKLDSKIKEVSESTCPECGSKLSEDKVKGMISVYEEKKKETEDLLNKHNQRIEQISITLEEKRKILLQTVDEIKRKSEDSISEINKQIEVFNLQLDSNKEKYNKLISLSKTSLLEQLNVDYATEVTTKQEALKNKLTSIQNEFSELSTNLARTENEYNVCLKAKKETEENFEIKKQNYYIQLLKESEISEDEYNLDTNLLVKQVTERNNLLASKTTIEELLKDVKERTKVIQENLEKVDNELQSIQEQYERSLVKYRMLQQLKNTRALRKYVFNQVSLFINENLKHFNLLMQLELEPDDNDNVNIYAVNMNGVRVPVEYLSAGESAVFKLSLYLVLERIFSTVKFPYLFIDENLDKLDSSNIKTVISALSQFKELNIYLITHKSEASDGDWDCIIDLGQDK